MPQPAKDGAGFTEIGSTEFGELRQLLLGPDLVRISELEQRFEDPAKRIADLARDLPDSIKSAKAKALRESLEPVFLIHRKSGILLQHAAQQGKVLKDADMISGMLTAIHDFVSDSFTADGQDLETVDTGRYKLWIQYGPCALVVGAVGGTAPVE